jgi:predicted Zn-dependent protease
MSSSKMFADLDLKEERFCRACSQRLFEGKVQL